jgi:LysR family nitrogen assimilation transcriptional regulator
MELSHLRAFIYVAEQGNVVRAAALLGMSQPTLSRRIQELEAELRTTVFRRAGHGMEITPSGHRFLDHAREILLRADAALDDMLRDAKTDQGQVVGGLPPSLGEIVIPRLAAEFVKRFPRGRLSIVEGGSGALFDQVLAERLDFAVIRNPTASSQIRAERLKLEALFLIGAAPLGSRHEAIGLAELSRVRLIMPTVADAKRSLISKMMSEGNFLPNIVMEVDSIGSTIELARAGFGYAVIPESTIAVLPRSRPRLHCQRIEAPGALANLCFVTSSKLGQNSLPAKAARVIREELVEILTTIASPRRTTKV